MWNTENTKQLGLRDRIITVSVMWLAMWMKDASFDEGWITPYPCCVDYMIDHTSLRSHRKSIVHLSYVFNIPVKTLQKYTSMIAGKGCAYDKAYDVSMRMGVLPPSIHEFLNIVVEEEDD